MKAFLINTLVVIVALSFVTPVYLMEWLKRSAVTDSVQKAIDLNQTQWPQYIYDQLAPLVLVLANYVLIPFLIDRSSFHLHFTLRSQRHKSNYVKHYLSLVTNALLIPLFGLTSIETLYSYLTSTTMISIEMKAIQTTNFFVRFLAGLSLFSNSISALDLPHWITKSWKKFMFSRLPAYMQLSPEKFEDTWYFDQGY